MWETLSIPLTVVGSAFLATLADGVAPGCAPVLFFGLVLLLPRLWQAPMISVLLITGVTSVVALCASLPLTRGKRPSAMRLPAVVLFVALAAVGAMLSAWLDYWHTLVFVVFVTALWVFTTIKGMRLGSQDALAAPEAGWHYGGAAGVLSFAAGTSGFGLRPMADRQGRFVGWPGVAFTPRTLLVAALVIAGAKALVGQTPPILAGGAALGALPGLVVGSLARRLLKHK